jgi:hypothetical protein
MRIYISGENSNKLKKTAERRQLSPEDRLDRDGGGPRKLISARMKLAKRDRATASQNSVRMLQPRRQSAPVQ